MICFRALHDVFLKLNEDHKKNWRSNTCLVLTNILKFGFVYDELPKVSLSFVVFEKGSKYLKQLTSEFVKSKSQITYLETIQDWIGYFKKLPLFEKVGLPNCFMFHTGGWVKSHRTSQENETKVTVIGKRSTLKQFLKFAINRPFVFCREYFLFHHVSSEQPGDLHEEEDRLD